MTARHNLYVFFCVAPKNATLWNRFWGWFVRWLTWSPGEHICTGYDGIVVDPLYAGDHLWQLNGFVRRYPIRVCVSIRVLYPIDMRAFDRPKVTKNRWLPILFWLTGIPRFRSDDCLGVAVECLRAAGIDAPTTIRTPGGLFRWLRSEGYVHQILPAPDRWLGWHDQRVA
jgi:hypothetical protein